LSVTSATSLALSVELFNHDGAELLGWRIACEEGEVIDFPDLLVDCIELRLHSRKRVNSGLVGHDVDFGFGSTIM